MTPATRLTRAAGLERLAGFAPTAGRDYAERRNTEAGPGSAPTTSVLSPFLRRRLVLEREAIDAATAAQGGQAGKFVDEVFWRSYFKGHLETRPAIWSGYLDLLARDRERMAGSGGLRRAFAEAVSGRTGVEGFDDWARQLVDCGWLHNHARMWFASIWIFTLRLPWALGADFFLRHLLDGDPASNTLSWRWVAGLHTRGKPYAARAENIRRCTEGRFSPTGLNENPAALEEGTTYPLVSLAAAGPLPRGDRALLLHLDDLHPESLPLDGGRIDRVAAMPAHVAGTADPVRAADAVALADALARAGDRFGCPVVLFEPGWAADLPVVSAWAPVGPSADALPSGCHRVRRNWDEAAWPHATRGYFAVRSAIPAILRDTAPAAAG